MMRKLRVLLILITTLLFIMGCKGEVEVTKDTHEVNKPVPDNNALSNQVITYENFDKLFFDSAKTLKIEGFDLKNGTFEEELVIVDKDLSFNTREILSLEGKIENNTPIRTTQRMLIFEDEDTTKQVIIKFAYTKNFIGNDIIEYSKTKGLSDIDQNLSQKTDILTFSYKNLIIIVHQNAEAKIDSEITKKATRAIQSYLKNF
ncbi:hypothetical protein JJQ72_03520 [Paenibacillus sp. F411]|uniref:hypothetical protein n=1 Tax=Paenibacillus sp. F411 TaxID=2820239 RepID=UPI001AAF09D8|nr:hypothetical protein [Paenibacillus sp. F411]MBO2943049.1 hypothetical protein [Paenibacillus sp. F411]